MINLFSHISRCLQVPILYARICSVAVPNASAGNMSEFVVPGGAVSLFVAKADAMGSDTSQLKLL